MRKRARMALTGLVVLCCAVAGLLPAGNTRAGSAESSGGMTFGQSIGAFFASVYGSVRDFFVSGRALRLLESVNQSIEDFAVRLFTPLASVVFPLLQRIAPNLSTTCELVAIWMFWIAVVIVLIILILVLRPRHATHRRLPKVSPKTPGQGETSIEFGLVEQGPPPTSTTSLDHPVTSPAVVAQQQEPASKEETVVPEQSSSIAMDSPPIPEISLEPLGFFGNEGMTREAAPAPAITEPSEADAVSPPLLQVAGTTSEPETPAEAPESATLPPAEVPSEALLENPGMEPETLEAPVQPSVEPFVEPDLTPFGQAAPMQAVETPIESEGSVEPLDQPVPTSATMQVDETMVEQARQQATESEQASVEEGEPATPAAETEAEMQETGPAPSSSDVLSRMLEEESAFQRAAKPVEEAVSVSAIAPGPVPGTGVEPSMFVGTVDLDVLLQEGVVGDAAALSQLFAGGYRNRISKLAVSAKDLQNVPEEIRNVVKLTIVALSPIELSIARDLAMRLEAPGFVGEALLVAKKMGYATYLTTYKNISRNYKDVSIVETVNLKTPQEAMGPDAGDGLISFN